MLTVHFDDPQVAAAMAAVELCMEHDDDKPPVMIGAPRDMHARAALTDLVRQQVDRLVAA